MNCQNGSVRGVIARWLDTAGCLSRWTLSVSVTTMSTSFVDVVYLICEFHLPVSFAVSGIRDLAAL